MGTHKAKALSAGEDSPSARIQEEVGQHPKLRQVLIKQLQERLKPAKIITYFASFRSAAGTVGDADAEAIESLLAVEHGGDRKVFLIVNSPGGQALAAERIVNVCRSYSGNKFEVVVPHMAKSAATMICFGANKIWMSDTAELGPVDPQLQYKDDAGGFRWISAEEMIRSFESLMKDAASGTHKRIEPFLQQLQRYDARLIEQLRSAQSLSGDISIRLLQTGMMKGESEDAIRAKIELFLTQKKTKTHGRMITFEEAKNCGLALEHIDLKSDTWNVLWELYVRSDWVVGRPGVAKLIESDASSMVAGGPKES